MKKILIIDDHPSMIEGYKTILDYVGEEFVITSACDCESAYNAFVSEKNFDLVFLDINLPPFISDKLRIESGVDLAKIFKTKKTKCKLIILTSHVDAITLYSIVRESCPEGLLVKCDFSSEELITAVKAIISGEKYYSATVRSTLNSVNKQNVFLDSYNRQLILLISSGIKTKNLPNYINLSLSAIDKRKVQIKDFLGINRGSDEDIIREAKRNGLI